MRKTLIPKFARAGITICEARGPGCWRDNGLTFAHRFKRRFITTQEELAACALLCIVCHAAVERLSHYAMRVEIDRIIAARAQQP